jgi:hypothetical protein
MKKKQTKEQYFRKLIKWARAVLDWYNENYGDVQTKDGGTKPPPPPPPGKPQ